MAEVLDFILGIGFIIVFVLVSWGIMIQTMDEQCEYEARRDYDKMKREVEKNDSSRSI
jgi:hydrogenase maturation factor